MSLIPGSIHMWHLNKTFFLSLSPPPSRLLLARKTRVLNSRHNSHVTNRWQLNKTSFYLSAHPHSVFKKLFGKKDTYLWFGQHSHVTRKHACQGGLGVAPPAVPPQRLARPSQWAATPTARAHQLCGPGKVLLRMCCWPSTAGAPPLVQAPALGMLLS